jgi:NADPH2:quinone reductase
MNAWLLKDQKGLGSLELTSTHPAPRAGAGEVVLEMLYAALNPADRYLAEGQYPARPSFPHVLGRDGIGIVCEVGENAGAWEVGQKAVIVRSDVGVERAGTFAERVAVPVESLVHPPKGWTDEQSAGATLVYLTAWQAITQWFDLPKPATMLITGASGGVGVAATQIGRAMNHRVIALSRSSAKSETLRSLGAEITLDPTSPDWHKQLIKQLGGRKVDLAIDNIGGAGFSQLLDVMNVDGRVSCVGRLAGPVPQFNTAALFFRRLQIRGVSVGAYAPEESASAWMNVVQVLGDARPMVDKVFDFDQLPAAFERLAAGPMGKVLLRVKRGA